LRAPLSNSPPLFFLTLLTCYPCPLLHNRSNPTSLSSFIFNKKKLWRIIGESDSRRSEFPPSSCLCRVQCAPERVASAKSAPFRKAEKVASCSREARAAREHYSMHPPAPLCAVIRVRALQPLGPGTWHLALSALGRTAAVRAATACGTAACGSTCQSLPVTHCRT
jgi:hypothetical protein